MAIFFLGKETPGDLAGPHHPLHRLGGYNSVDVVWAVYDWWRGESHDDLHYWMRHSVRLERRDFSFVWSSWHFSNGEVEINGTRWVLSHGWVWFDSEWMALKSLATCISFWCRTFGSVAVAYSQERCHRKNIQQHASFLSMNSNFLSSDTCGFPGAYAKDLMMLTGGMVSAMLVPKGKTTLKYVARLAGYWGGVDKVLMTPGFASSSDSVEVSKKKHAHTDDNVFPNTPGSLIVFLLPRFCESC